MSEQANDTRRVSERAGFVPLRTGDPIPDELRSALNVSAFVRELLAAIPPSKVIEGDKTCISTSKLTV